MKKLLIILMLIASSNAFSQSYYDVLKQCIANSPQLKALNANLTADSLSLRRGLNPVDPEVEVEYYFGQDFEAKIVQQFDFPTLYHQRNMISKNGINKAQLEYDANLRALMLKVSDLYQEFVYYNKMVDVLTQRKEHMTKLSEVVKKALDVGQVTAIEFKKINVMLRATTVQYNEALNVLSDVETKLEQMGIVLNSSTEFENFDFKGHKQEFVDLIMANEPLVEMLKADSLIAKHELKLARQEWIPKINLGYKAEFGESGIKHGIMAGISLPLWQNRNNVKYCKAKAKAQSAAMENQIGLVKIDLEMLYDNYETARDNVAMWKLEGIEDYESLLQKTMQSGTISAMEYLLDLTDWQATQLQMITDKYLYSLYGSRMAIYFSFN